MTVFLNAWMSAQADSVCGAEYGTISADRMNRRNGYRSREFDTRAGTLELAIPKLRTGSYFPDWLLERRNARSAGAPAGAGRRGAAGGARSRSGAPRFSGWSCRMGCGRSRRLPRSPTGAGAYEGWAQEVVTSGRRSDVSEVGARAPRPTRPATTADETTATWVIGLPRLGVPDLRRALM
jgi:hypothetical protein